MATPRCPSRRLARAPAARVGGPSATMLARPPDDAERVIETGTRGEGGDRTLVIDEAAEDVVFAELDALHAAGARFTAVSEERGDRRLRRRRTVRVVIDPIDGSMNAKRGLPHFALSIAVADGHDDGRRRRSASCTTSAPTRSGSAVRGARGAAGRRAARPRRCPSAATRDGKLEVLGDRVGRPALGRPVGRRAGRDRAPAAGDRGDRGLALPGGGGALRRDGVAEALPGGRRRRGPADRARGRRPRRLHRL